MTARADPAARATPAVPTTPRDRRVDAAPAAVPATPDGPAPAALRERWFACSNALGWTGAAQWPDPTVDEVCRVVVAGDERPELERALGAWAVARARAGIGLAETLTDLAALHAAVLGALGDLVPHDGAHLPGADGSRLVRVVSLAWTDVACGELAETAVLDPLSGLPTESYLRARLGELYDAARARATRVGLEHALVTVSTEVAGWSRIAPLTVVGEAAGIVFDAGETVAVLGRAVVVVLAPREGLAGRVRVLRRLVERRTADAPGVLSPPVVRTVPLPATFEGVSGVLDRLHEPDRTPL